MSDAAGISDLELHALLDGELPEARRAAVAAAVAREPALAARLAAFAEDRARLASAFREVGEAPLPAAWIARIEREAAPSRSRWRGVRGPALAIAASVLLVVGGLWAWSGGAGPGPILEAAVAARAGDWVPEQSFGASVPAARLRDAVGDAVRPPDLARFGFRLAAAHVYRGGGAELVYRRASGAALTIFLRKSDGRARFEMRRRGDLRLCLWQDDVVAAVVAGEMSAGEMMRVASRAYADLNL